MGDFWGPGTKQLLITRQRAATEASETRQENLGSTREAPRSKSKAPRLYPGSPTALKCAPCVTEPANGSRIDLESIQDWYSKVRIYRSGRSGGSGGSPGALGGRPGVPKIRFSRITRPQNPGRTWEAPGRTWEGIVMIRGSFFIQIGPKPITYPFLRPPNDKQITLQDNTNDAGNPGRTWEACLPFGQLNN